MRVAALFVFLLAVAVPAGAQQDSALRPLQTGTDSRGWEAVGRIELGQRGFCTGALIADDIVLTAAHCLFDKETGARMDPSTIEFLAGWRNGRASAYRRVAQAVSHPDYVFDGRDSTDGVRYDLALLKLDKPIRLPSIHPFATTDKLATGDEVGVISYAQDRSEAPSLQQICHVLERRPEALVLSCDVDFGSSGAPIFSVRGGEVRIVSVVSAKAEMGGRKVSLGTPLEEPLAALMDELSRQAGRVGPGNVRVLSGGGGGKFLRP